MGPVGAEVAEFGNVDQLVVDDRRALHLAVDEDRAGLGRAVSVGQVNVEQGLDERPHLRRDGRGARHRRDEPSAEEVLAQVGEHVGFDGPSIGSVGRPAVDFALELLEHHVPDPRHEAQLSGPHQCQVFEERRKIASGNEICCAAGSERGVQNAAPHHVAHRHEVQRDRRGGALIAPHRHARPAPRVRDQPLGYIAPFGVPVLPEV